MNRWERERIDAALDDAAPAMVGQPCPVCGDASKEGSGPCSEACEIALERAERREDIRAEWAEDAAMDDDGDEDESSWMEAMG
jgi:hypothetical protein